MGRRQGLSPGEEEAGVRVMPRLLGGEQRQQGYWLGPSSTGGAGKVLLPEASIGPQPGHPAFTAIVISTGAGLLSASCHADWPAQQSDPPAPGEAISHSSSHLP